MSKHLRLIPLFFLFLSLVSAQESGNNFGIKFNGWARTDIFYDSRQSSILREGHFLLYPENISKDANGKDMNAEGSFNILSICTRLKGSITAPDVLGAKTTGLIEGEFFGMSENDVNGFRLRHAFLKLSWPKDEILVGQFWHPMFCTDAYPGTVSFNTGSPFQPFTRNPQVRYTRLAGAFRIIATAFTQRDFVSMGPDPKDPSKSLSGSLFLRNAGMPDLDLQLQFRPSGTDHIIGAGIDYKTIMPELYTTGSGGKKYKSSEKLPGLSYFAFVKLNTKPLNIKLYAMMAENATDLTMIGGYACRKITDTVTGAREWENIRTSSAWIDMQTNTQKFRGGLFLGYSKNLGAAADILTNTYYSRGTTIDYLYRVSPRGSYINGKFELSFELEYTVAAYGTLNKKGKISDSNEVANIRPLLIAVLNF